MHYSFQKEPSDNLGQVVSSFHLASHSLYSGTLARKTSITLIIYTIIIAFLVLSSISVSGAERDTLWYSRDLSSLSEADWVSAFEETRKRQQDFQVESINEFKSITKMYDAAVHDGTEVHRFHLKNDDIVQCILTHTQGSLRLRPESVQYAPSVEPVDTSPERARTEPIDIGKYFGVDGLPDEDGNTRACPQGSFPRLIPRLENFYRFRKLKDIYQKYPGEPVSLAQIPNSLTSVCNPPPQCGPPVHEYAQTRKNIDNIGSSAVFSVWSPYVEQPKEFSLSQLWVPGGCSDPTVNTRQTVETGWQVYPWHYGDNEPRLFIFYTTKNYEESGDDKQCYNLECRGFVQTNNSVIIGGPLTHSTIGGTPVEIELMFYRNPADKNWWLKFQGTWIGYYPNSLFNSQGIADKSNLIVYGGEIVNQTAGGLHTTTEMGNGFFPIEGNAAYNKQLKYVDMNNNLKDSTDLERRVADCNDNDISTYYDLSLYSSTDLNWGEHFYFGGPGRFELEPIKLPKTGQTSCYDSAGNVKLCAGTGHDGDIQAGVPWPNPRFTDNGDGTMTDNLTGLMWTIDANLPGSYKTWIEAVDYVAAMNSSNNFNHNDWRLPTINELESLTNAGEPDVRTWLAIQKFVNVQSGRYWSSTTDAYATYFAWVLNLLTNGFSAGYLDKQSKLLPLFVWPVRFDPKSLATGTNVWDVSSPSPRFTNNGDGTVTDDLTGLMWTKDAYSPGPSPCNPAKDKLWEDALAHVACLNSTSYLGYSDWRLPNRKEILSLIDRSQYGFALPINSPFFNLGMSYSSLYWTSTTNALLPATAWGFDIADGSTQYYGKNSWLLRVWPVRGPSQTCPTPGVPSSPLPSNGATGTSTSPTLTWASTANTDSYDVYFGTSPNPPHVGSTMSASYPVSGLSNGTTYYWKIVAKNACGNSTTGSVWNFTTASANDTVLLTSPLDNAVLSSCSLINTHQPPFVWSTSGTFTNYSILFSTSPTDFTSRGVLVAMGSAKAPNGSWTPSIALWKKIVKSSDNSGSIRDIYWKVIGARPDRTTVESGVRSFRIGDPQTVAVISPADGATFSMTSPPTFNFDSNCNVKFRLEFSPQSDNFNNPKKVKGVAYQVKDPVTENLVNWTLGSKFWTGVVKSIGNGSGVFRIKAWDGMNRATVSETRSFHW